MSAGGGNSDRSDSSDSSLDVAVERPLAEDPIASPEQQIAGYINVDNVKVGNGKK